MFFTKQSSRRSSILLLLLALHLVIVQHSRLWQARTPIRTTTSREDGNGEEEQRRLELVKKTSSDSNSRIIQVFYNLYTKGPDDEERVQSIVDEQFSFLNSSVHNMNVSITSIGHQLTNITNGIIRQHYKEGDESLTLRALWDYCRDPSNNNNKTKIIYLHSKGSFHNTPENTKLRRFNTEGAMSTECANLPDRCNVCSSRMSPLPHPHSPGNMWLARCDYVAKLVDPYVMKEGRLPFLASNYPCRGWGRAFYEHWVHSHPSVKPCDL